VTATRLQGSSTGFWPVIADVIFECLFGRGVEVALLEFATMKSSCVAAALIVLAVLVAGCSTTSSSADNQTAQTGSDSYILHSTNGAGSGAPTSRPPRLTVGVSDPNTQLILPWFLNDIINFVNYH
jgi:hypothetical protein